MAKKNCLYVQCGFSFKYFLFWPTLRISYLWHQKRFTCILWSIHKDGPSTGDGERKKRKITSLQHTAARTIMKMKTYSYADIHIAMVCGADVNKMWFFFRNKKKRGNVTLSCMVCQIKIYIHPWSHKCPRNTEKSPS